VKWSKYQIKIFRRVYDTEDNIVIDAVAGSGKSTTLFKIARILKDKSILFFAFNTHIEQYAKKKLKPCTNVQVKTTHAYGLDCIRKSPKFKHSEFNVSKVWDCICKNVDKFAIRGSLYNVINALRTFGCMEYTGRDILDFIRDNPAIVDQIGDIKFVANHSGLIAILMQKLDNDIKTYDFNDMLRFPILYRLMNYGYLPEVLLVDETQDLSFYQFEYIKHFLKNDVRIISVGDENQAIYAFRGANGNALNTIQKLSKAKRLPLSLTYRCKSRIVNYVKRVYDRAEYDIPDIEPYEKGGKVIDLIGSKHDYYCLSVLMDNEVDMIVSPKNKHIINIWFELLEIHNTPSSLKGSNICAMLTKLFKSLKTNTSFPGVVGQLTVMSKSEDLNVADMAQAGLRFVTLQKFRSYEEVFAKIKQLEEDNTSKIHLHTVHSSKGLESDKVFVINDFFDSDQKINMQYVGFTRASDELYVVQLPKR